MTTAQRETHLRRFASASLSDVTDDAADHHISLGRSVSSTLSVEWKKASELLKTDNAIVPSPGSSEGAKLVLSYRGNKPHLVTPNKGGGFRCDSDCPNLCSFCSVAELCHKLPEHATEGGGRGM